MIMIKQKSVQKKNKHIIYILYVLCVSNFGFWGCIDWLDVKPKQFTEEEDLFSLESGFKEALTGVYQMAARSNLYGSKLTFDYIDKLAQRYRFVTSSGEIPLQNPNYYDFRTEASERRIIPIWSDIYEIIANINNLLYWTDMNRHALVTPNYYNIIKGEALAFRSYLYFDLLRMFGPVYRNDPTAKSIVYRTALNRDIRELERADDMMGYIINDLIESKELLENSDPLNFDYINKNGATLNEDPFLIFRFKRMNALAVKALLARAYLYMGDNDNARIYALQVIESGKFTLTRNNISDCILSSEIVFALHINRMLENVTNRILASSDWIINDRDNFFRNLFNVDNDGENDFRMKPGAGFEETTYGAGTRVYIMKKFDQTGLHYGMTESMPMIRLAEMYYILSEVASTFEESTYWLNQVRNARGISSLPVFRNNTEKTRSIGIEYRKEFYGEGQLWYYYKRTGASVVQFFNMNNIMPEITDRNYIFNVPDDEYQFGGITQ